jgi:hypothetical protein
VSELSFQIPNTLSNPTTLPEDMKRTLTQLRQQNNRAPGVVKQPVLIGGKVPRGRKRGDMGSRPTTRGIAVRVYADKDSSREVEIPDTAKDYVGLQSGTAAPTADNFAENQFGWFYNTATSAMYFVVNNGGTITNISPSTLGITFTNISGTITDDQHGALGRVTSGTSPQPLHTNATTAQAGFMSSTDKTLLNTATTASSANTLVLRDANSDIICRRIHLDGQVTTGGIKVVGQQQTGWGLASGSAVRTSFDTETVTLIGLARRVKSLIDDLSATSGHGLLDA